MRNCVARQKLQGAAAYRGSARQRHSRTSLFFQSLAGLTRVPWAAVLCNTTSRCIPSAYPGRHSRVREPHAFEEPVRGASHAHRPPVEHVRVDLCGADIPVPEELLNGADVVPVLEQVGREGVAQGVRCGALRDPGWM